MSVAQLTSMGFSQEDAEQALQNHKTIEAAVEHLFSIASQREADLHVDIQFAEEKEAADNAAAEEEQGPVEEIGTALQAAANEESAAIEGVGEEKEAAEEAAAEQETAAVEKAASSNSLPETDGGIDHCYTAWHESAATEHVSAAAPVENDMPAATQTIGGDDASRWARWIPADAGTVDASKRATPWDHAQVLLSKSISSLRMHVSDRKKQPEKDSSQNSAEEVAEGSLVDLAEVETQEAADDEAQTLQAAAKWQEMAHKVSAVTAVETQGAPDEPWDHAQVLLSKSMSSLRTHTHPHVAKWQEIAHKVSASVISQSRKVLRQSRPTVETISPESGTAAGAVVAATVPEAETVNDSSVEEGSDADATLETITLESSAGTSEAAAATGSDEAEEETAAAHGRRLEETLEETFDRAQVLWSRSACALRSQVTGLLQGRQNSTQDPSQDSPQDSSQDAAAEECPAAAAPVEADASASPPAPGAGVDAAPDSASAAETAYEETRENATRFDHAQVLLSVSMAAFRSGISRIHAPNPITVQ